jgi:uncharacterized protein (TIGR03067 family)
LDGFLRLMVRLMERVGCAQARGDARPPGRWVFNNDAFTKLIHHSFVARWRSREKSDRVLGMSSAENLHGVWQAISVIVSGEEIPANDVNSIRLTLTATRFTTQRGGETLFDSSYSVDAAKTPMEIEMIGSGGDFEGQPALGIYVFEGETLRLCYKMPGFQRPTEFVSLPGSGAFLITLKRVQ